MAYILSALMWSQEDLVRRLSEVVDDTDCCESLDGIFDVVEVFSAVVREMVENVYAFDCGFSALLTAEDEVDPLVKMSTDIWGLQSLSVLRDEDLGISFGPWW